MIADQPNFFRVIRTDYWSFVCSILMIVFWALTLFDLFTRQEQMQASLFTAVMISVVTLMIVGWRYYRVSSLFIYPSRTNAGFPVYSGYDLCGNSDDRGLEILSSKFTL